VPPCLAPAMAAAAALLCSSGGGSSPQVLRMHAPHPCYHIPERLQLLHVCLPVYLYRAMCLHCCGLSLFWRALPRGSCYAAPAHRAARARRAADHH
jgi:hypothetical protein